MQGMADVPMVAEVECRATPWQSFEQGYESRTVVLLAAGSWWQRIEHRHVLSGLIEAGCWISRWQCEWPADASIPSEAA